MSKKYDSIWGEPSQPNQLDQLGQLDQSSMSHMARSGWCGALLVGFVVLAGGCNRSNSQSAQYPKQAPRTVNATSVDYSSVYVDQQRYAEPTGEVPDLVGYETLNNGEQVQVVTYVHTYPEPIESYPQVWWSGNWYYNINGNFVYYSPYYGSWCSYWGPPVALVYAWNSYYPWLPYRWGVGFYGAGWYWGGVSGYGYHAYGQRPVHPHHHASTSQGGRPQQNARPANSGGPSSPTPPSTRPSGPKDRTVRPHTNTPSPRPTRMVRSPKPEESKGRVSSIRQPGTQPERRPSRVSSRQPGTQPERRPSRVSSRQPKKSQSPSRTFSGTSEIREKNATRRTSRYSSATGRRTSRGYAEPGVDRSRRVARRQRSARPSPNRSRASYRPQGSAMRTKAVTSRARSQSQTRRSSSYRPRSSYRSAGSRSRSYSPSRRSYHSSPARTRSVRSAPRQQSRSYGGRSRSSSSRSSQGSGRSRSSARR